MLIDVATEDFFRLRLDHMIDLRHAMAVLASRMPQQQIEASVADAFCGKVRAGKQRWSETPVWQGRLSSTGASSRR